MLFTTTLALTALAISVLTFVLSYRAATAAERRSRLPVQVIVYDLDRGLLRNVGYGPARNIVMAQQHTTGEQAGTWYNPVRIPPLARDAESSSGRERPSWQLQETCPSR